MAICKAALLNLHMNLKIQIKISIYEFSMLEKDIKLYLETTIMKHQYPRFEFVIENTWEAFGGSSFEDVFNSIPHEFLGSAATDRERAQEFLQRHGLSEVLPTMKNKSIFYEAFFTILQNHRVGTWRWFNGIIGDYWRFSKQTNTLVRRKNRGMGTRVITPEHRAKIIANVNKLNNATPEEKAERQRKSKENLRKYWDNLSPEERKKRNHKTQIALSVTFAKIRKEAVEDDEHPLEPLP